jgi:hypothetical protein
MTTENKIIHIFRHGEAKERGDPVNPPLTNDGFEEATNMITELPPSMKAPTLVLVSPLKRCIETALSAFHREFDFHLRQKALGANRFFDRNKAFQHFLNGNVTFMLDPRLQEMGQPRESKIATKCPRAKKCHIIKIILSFPRNSTLSI